MGTASLLVTIKTRRVPKVSETMGVICFILDIFLPGIGTLLAGATEGKTDTMIIGVLQFFLAVFLVGWLWSIYWGYLIWKKSKGMLPI
ncbi:MAG: hypothetical protein MHM6MM_004544 [Cercozoa sp. M6MM]